MTSEDRIELLNRCYDPIKRGLAFLRKHFVLDDLAGI